MPELPEVETIRATLSEHIVGKTIARVAVFWEKIVRGTDPEDFCVRLAGKTIRSMGRYGKYLFFQFDSITLVSHLRMEGKYYLKPEGEPRDKHEHVIFTFTDHDTLRYHDTRKFGTMQIVPRGAEREAAGLSGLGPEPFDPAFTTAYLSDRAGTSRRAIKSWLLDQSVVSGLGNIYVNEVLFLCGIHPETRVCDLREEDFSRLRDSASQVLRKAVDLGGTTIRTYYSSLGVSGRFQNELNVHNRKGLPCPVCGTPVEKIQVGGRGTYFCPRCQAKRGRA